MSALLIAAICIVMVATSFLSGLFGMAGGQVLVGVLLLVLPLPTAMALHGVTQVASNVWRAMFWWRHIRLRIAIAYVAGCAVALGIWSAFEYVPSVPVALLSLGAVPFLARLIPQDLRPVPEKPLHGGGYGVLCMTLMLLTGVAGPVLDQFFLNGKMDRREIVATKGVCQVCGHGFKLLYFGALIENAGDLDPMLAVLAIFASMTGTALSKKCLEAMSDAQYRRWSGWLVTTISGSYVVYGSWLMISA